MGASKPSIIITGNCHARYLRNRLVQDPLVADQYDVYWATTNQTIFDRGITDSPTEDAVKQCAFYFRQIGIWDKQTAVDESALPASCRKFIFPDFLFMPLWPLTGEDPRNKPNPEHPFGLFPHGDWYILQQLKKGIGFDEIERKYLSTELNAITDLKRGYEMWMEELQQLDAMADFKFCEFIGSHFREERLFLTINHPSLILLTRLGKTVYDCLGLACDPDLMAAWPFLEATRETPIHPDVIEHYGLQWITKENRYPYHGCRVSFEEYVRHYIAFVPCCENQDGRLTKDKLISRADWIAARLQRRLAQAEVSSQALIAAFEDQTDPVSQDEIDLLRRNIEQAKQDGRLMLAETLGGLLAIAQKDRWAPEAAAHGNGRIAL
jgi:hypothetical protein